MDTQPDDQGITQEQAKAAVERILRQLGVESLDGYHDVRVGFVKDGIELPPGTLVIPPTMLPEGHPLRELILSKVREVVERGSEQADDDDAIGSP